MKIAIFSPLSFVWFDRSNDLDMLWLHLLFPGFHARWIKIYSILRDTVGFQQHYNENKHYWRKILKNSRTSENSITIWKMHYLMRNAVQCAFNLIWFDSFRFDVNWEWFVFIIVLHLCYFWLGPTCIPFHSMIALDITPVRRRVCIGIWIVYISFSHFAVSIAV